MLNFGIVMMMPYAAIVTIFVCFLELGLWLPSGRTRLIRARLTLLLLIPSAIWFGFANSSWYILLFIFITLYRSINLARLIKQRRQPDHLLSASRQASCWLLVAQLVSFYLVINSTRDNGQMGLLVLLLIATVGVAILFAATQRNLRKTRPTNVLNLTTDELPTLSVLIPARNETEDLADCLTSLIKSTYPKLEIIVLDDCSQNKRTPEIIKDFAHAGVRFIAGVITPDGWLAKNYAYHQLQLESSGELLLFCGVDTRYRPETLTYMVNELLVRKKTMMSYLPANAVPAVRTIEASLIQPGRYAWELFLPRRAIDRPPVLSTVWIIANTTLKAAGNFKSVKRAATPERQIARYASQHDDGYSFTQSDSVHGVSNCKSATEQRATAIRTRYPQLHQSLELTALTTALEICVLLFPFILYVHGLNDHTGLVFITAEILCILLIIMFAQVMNITYRKFLWRSVWLYPFAAIYDVMLLNYSMYRYEFSTVDWKGRNVCIPVMDVIPHLPSA